MTNVCQWKGVHAMVKICNKWVVFLSTTVLCLVLSLLAFNLNAYGKQLVEGSVIRVFLVEDYDQQLMMEKFQQIPGVTEAQFLSEEQVAKEFETIFGQPWIGVNDLPALVDLSVNLRQANAVVESVEQLTGIEYIAFHAQNLSSLSWMGAAFTWFSGVLFLLAIFLFSRSCLMILRGRNIACES